MIEIPLFDINEINNNHIVYIYSRRNCGNEEIINNIINKKSIKSGYILDQMMYYNIEKKNIFDKYVGIQPDNYIEKFIDSSYIQKIKKEKEDDKLININTLNKIVKEKGISDIILKYKYELESLELGSFFILDYSELNTTYNNHVQRIIEENKKKEKIILNSKERNLLLIFQDQCFKVNPLYSDFIFICKGMRDTFEFRQFYDIVGLRHYFYCYYSFWGIYNKLEDSECFVIHNKKFYKYYY